MHGKGRMDTHEDGWMEGDQVSLLWFTIHWGKEARKQMNYNATWKALIYQQILDLKEMTIYSMDGKIQEKMAEPGNSG